MKYYELWDKTINSLLRIVYSESADKAKELFIPKEYHKDIRVKKYTKNY